MTRWELEKRLMNETEKRLAQCPAIAADEAHARDALEDENAASPIRFRGFRLGIKHHACGLSIFGLACAVLGTRSCSIAHEPCVEGVVKPVALGARGW
ncbi:hypothetical protein [Methylobacterium sp. AMS5]|uniref:hypothetical protein n=1 Tax=Methylobacterium sp. AMS5 TaxID=925818 RepID=UPI000A7826B7|nr:hypothetical protein [Methylobacterium sp. AMS5]